MNPPVSALEAADFDAAEHILLEEEDPITAAAQADVDATWQIKHLGRGAATVLSVANNGVLRAVTTKRGKQMQERWINLRFVDPELVPFSHTAWRALATSIGLGAFAALWWLVAGDVALLRPAFLPLGILAATASVCGIALSAHRSFRGIRLLSLNGRAPVAQVTVACWPNPQFRNLQLELPDFIDAAQDANPQDDDAALRDEMRDHHRMKAQGYMDAASYERAKARILSCFG